MIALCSSLLPIKRICELNSRHNHLPLPFEEAIGCDHFDRCSGCTQRIVSRCASHLEAQRFFRRVGHPEVPLIVGPVHGWRCRARLVVGGRPGQANIGLYKAKSHTVIDIPYCSVHHPRINKAVAVICKVVNCLAITPYNEDTHSGELRYLQLTAADSDAKRCKAQDDVSALVQVVLVWNDESLSPNLLSLANALWQVSLQLPAQLFHSIWVSHNTRRSNVILGQRFKLLHGNEWLEQNLGGAPAFLAPGSFAQANYGAMDAALQFIEHAVPFGATVVDLHSGSGTIGLAIAAHRRPHWVRFVETNQHSEPAFQRAQSALRREGINVEMQYIVAPAGSRPNNFLKGAEICIVDPPRKGLDPVLLQALSRQASDVPAEERTALYKRETPANRLPANLQGASNLQRLIYLSCGFAAFRRDCANLLASNCWKLSEAYAFLFFPGTDNVELLAIFDHIDDVM